MVEMQKGNAPTGAFPFSVAPLRPVWFRRQSGERLEPMGDCDPQAVGTRQLPAGPCTQMWSASTCTCVTDAAPGWVSGVLRETDAADGATGDIDPASPDGV